MTEEWRPVLGYEGMYEVSSVGRVRGVGRFGETRPGVIAFFKPKILRGGMTKDGYPRVWLTRNNRRTEYRVSRLVCAAWHGPCPEGMECRHLDDNKLNNTPSNLRWGTRSENTYDKVRNGRHPMASRTHCIRGHQFDDENTYITPIGSRACRTCRAAEKRARRAQTEKEAA